MAVCKCCESAKSPCTYAPFAVARHRSMRMRINAFLFLSLKDSYDSSQVSVWLLVQS